MERSNHQYQNPQRLTKRMQATARMASFVSSTFPARRRLIRSVLPPCERDTVVCFERHPKVSWYSKRVLKLQGRVLGDSRLRVDDFADGLHWPANGFGKQLLCDALRFERLSQCVPWRSGVRQNKRLQATRARWGISLIIRGFHIAVSVA